MSIFSTLSTLGREVAKATATAQTSIAASREQITAKRHELAHAEKTSLPRDEIKARIRSAIRADGSHHLTENTSRLIHAFGKPGEPTTPWTWREPMTWGAACAYLGPMLEESLCAAVDAAEYVAGPTSDERPALVAKLSRELAELEADEEAAIDAAIKAGVTIAHRPEVVTRRQREAAERESNEKRIGAARARQERVDRSVATRIIGQSEYLTKFQHPHPS